MADHSLSLSLSLSDVGMDVERLQMFFFPMMAHGHMLPMVDMSVSFAKRGVLVTIITTPYSASLVQKTIDRAVSAGYHLKVHLIKLPCAEAGLPDRVDHTDQIASDDMFKGFLKAISMFQQPFERLIEEHRPNCLVADAFLPWTVDSAAKFGIPTLFFTGTSCFASSAGFSLARHNPHQHLESDTQVFVIPGLPHRIEMTRLQLPHSMRVRNHSSEFWERRREAESRSYGILANSFCELESEYVEFLSKEVGKKVWPIGPVSLSDQDIVDKADRGKKADIDEDECLRWLDSMNPSSVVYVSFGSNSFGHGNRQLVEIASALEASGHPFIWVVKNYESLSNEAWLPDGFEERTEGKGLIIRGWTPQILILNHPSVGAFITHCGWNSVIEGISAGLPMITWPASAEQFFNEKLITEVLKIGVGVGVTEWVNFRDARPLVKRNDIEMAVREVMDGGEEAEEIRKRVKQLSETAKCALEEGGSSYLAVTDLIDQLKKICGFN